MKRFIKKFFIIQVFTVALILGTACKTTGVFPGTALLTVMIVDENGQGVRDFNLTLSNFNKSEKGITNSSGICVFENIPSGEYELCGKKNGYVKLSTGRIHFFNKGDVFCFSVLSGSSAFEQVQALYECGNYAQGLELMDNIVCEKKSQLSAAVSFFKAYAYAAMNETKAKEREIKKIKSASREFAEKYSVAVASLGIIEKEIVEEQEENQ